MSDDNKTDIKKQSVPTFEDAKEGLFRSIKSSDDPQVRRYATFFLGQLKDKEEIGYLAALLRDPDKGVREQATRALAGAGEPAAGQLIPLLEDTDWKVRYRAAEALGMMQNKKAVPLLIKALGDSKDHVRYMAVKSLGEIGENMAVQPVILGLKDENEFVRKSAAIALGKMGGQSAKEALSGGLIYEKSEAVRSSIRDAIALIK
jgi:HEAT repeat protein